MTIDMALSYGSHHRIAQKVEQIRINVTADREVELVASLLPDPMVSSPASLMATSVAIHMDQSVATELYERLRGTFRTMGWPLPKEGERQA
jgi:hypothetical protein